MARLKRGAASKIKVLQSCQSITGVVFEPRQFFDRSEMFAEPPARSHPGFRAFLSGHETVLRNSLTLWFVLALAEFVWFLRSLL